MPPPCLSPLVSIHLFPMSVSLFLLCDVRYSNLEFQGEDRTENQLLGVVCIDSVFKAMGLDEIKGGSVDRKLKD